MKKTPLWKIEPFIKYFTESQWTVQNMFGPQLGSKSYCKICDSYTPNSDLETHLSVHKKEVKNIKKKQKEEANQRRIAAAKAARLAKKERKK